MECGIMDINDLSLLPRNCDMMILAELASKFTKVKDVTIVLI
jgi:hypothetical protein